VEAQIAGEKSYFECPVKLMIYGTNDPSARPKLEQRLMKSKVLTSAQINRTKKDMAMQKALQRQP
jgi:SWI/SNF-related matrix-associated actin-dependent regulator of chromatin subfamily A3